MQTLHQNIDKHTFFLAKRIEDQQHHIYLHSKKKQVSILQPNNSTNFKAASDKYSELDKELDTLCHWGTSIALPKFNDGESTKSVSMQSSANSSVHLTPINSETSSVSSEIPSIEELAQQLEALKPNLLSTKQKKSRPMSVFVSNTSAWLSPVKSSKPSRLSTKVKRNVKRSRSLLVLHSWESLEDYVNSQEVIELAEKNQKTTKEQDPLLDDFLVLLNRSNNSVQDIVTAPDHAVKKGHLTCSKKIYWCILTKTSILMYPMKNASTPIDKIALYDCVVKDKTVVLEGRFRFSVKNEHSQKRTLFRGVNEEDVKSWVDAISSVLKELRKEDPIQQQAVSLDTKSNDATAERRKRMSRKLSDPLLVEFLRLLDKPEGTQSMASIGRSGIKTAVKKVEFDEQGLAKAASVDGVLELLLSSEYAKKDPEFGKTIILTYRYFHEPLQLLDLLSKKYHFYKTNISRARIIDLIGEWISTAFSDFLNAPEMMNEFNNFIDTIVEEEPRITLRNFIHKYTKTGKQIGDRKYSTRLLPPVLSRVRSFSSAARFIPGCQSEFLEHSPQLLAEQLTLLEHEIFSSIPMAQCFNQAWTTDKAEELSPIVMAYISRFNRMSMMVGTDIVTAANISQRVAIIKRYITIAKKCYGFNNFNTSIEICCGLNLASISRLKETWKAVPKKYLGILAKLTEIYTPENNYKNYREVLKTKKPPMNPYLALALRDLSLIELHNKTRLPSSLINIEKLRIISNILLPIRKMQEVQYNFQRDPAILKYLNEYRELTEEELYKHSLNCETPARPSLVI